MEHQGRGGDDAAEPAPPRTKQWQRQSTQGTCSQGSWACFQKLNSVYSSVLVKPGKGKNYLKGGKSPPLNGFKSDLPLKSLPETLHVR